MAYTRKLDPIETRVAGALMEKQQTTPDNYPLTVNSLLLACNQKSNRDPVTELSEEQVLDALDRLRQDVLVWRVEGARVERWEHRLTSRWHLDRAAKALMTLLLLRGAQTPGELRSRTERLHAFEDVEAVEAKLREMSEGDDALVRELAREPGKRERRWIQVMTLDDAPGDGLPDLPAEVAPDTTVAGSATTSPAPRVEASASTAGIAGGDYEELERRVTALEKRLARLENALGPIDDEA